MLKMKLFIAPLLAITFLANCGGKKDCTLSFLGEGYSATNIQEKYQINTEANITLSAKEGYKLPAKSNVNVTINGVKKEDFTYILDEESKNATFKIVMTDNVIVSFDGVDELIEDVDPQTTIQFINSRRYSTDKKVPSSLIIDITFSDFDLSEAELKNIARERYGVNNIVRKTDGDVTYYNGAERIDGTNVEPYFRNKMPQKFGIPNCHAITPQTINDVYNLSPNSSFFAHTGSGKILYEVTTSTESYMYQSTTEGYISSLMWNDKVTSTSEEGEDSYYNCLATYTAIYN